MKREEMEAKNELMKLYISNMRKAAELIDSVFIPTIQDFDGKVFNARLENTLKKKLEAPEAKDNIYCNVELNYSRCKIELNFCNHRSIFYNQKLWNSEETERRIMYLPSGMSDIDVCYLFSDYNQYDSSKNESFHKPTEGHYFYIGDYPNYSTRICSAAIIEGLKEKQKYLLETAAEYEDAISLKEGYEHSPVEDWMLELDSLKKQIELLHREIPCNIAAVYDIKSYANWY